MAKDTLKGLNVAILVTDGFEQDSASHAKRWTKPAPRPRWYGTSLGCVFFIRQAIVRQALFTRPPRCSSALEGAGSGKEACAWALSAGSSWG